MSPVPVAYCLGFAFDPTLRQVVLLQKAQPAFLRGHWTGVGGHVEPGETPLAALVREFAEEAGLVTAPEGWVHLGEHGRDATERLDVYAGTLPLTGLRARTAEPVQVFDLKALPTPLGLKVPLFLAQAREVLRLAPHTRLRQPWVPGRRGPGSRG
jgi:8-oxo-dGTP pyrophosphatase MutT (NUDIX family)